jgi:hypothetical protein
MVRSWETQSETGVLLQEKEIRQDIADLKHSSKKNKKFIQIARGFSRKAKRQRADAIEEFWKSICYDPLNQHRGEYLASMGQRLLWYVHSLEGLEQLQHPPLPRIAAAHHPMVMLLQKWTDSWDFWRPIGY